MRQLRQRNHLLAKSTETSSAWGLEIQAGQFGFQNKVSGITGSQHLVSANHLHDSLWSARFQRKKGKPFFKWFNFFPHYFTLYLAVEQQCVAFIASSSPRDFFFVPLPLISVLLFQQRSAKWQRVSSPLSHQSPVSGGNDSGYHLDWMGGGVESWAEVLRWLFLYDNSITVLAVVRSAAHHFYSFSAAP